MSYLAEAFGKAGRKHPAKIRAPFKAVRPEDDGCGCFRSLSSPALPSAADRKASPSTEPVPLRPELRAFLDFYKARLSRHRGHPSELTAPSINEQAQLQAAAERYGVQRLEQLAQAFFGSDSRILHCDGYGLGAFLEVLPTLAVLRLKSPPLAPRQVLAAEPKVTTWAPQREE